MIRKLLNKNHICMFLDFDGVINTFLKEGTEREKNAYKDPDSFDFCDANCIDMLNQLDTSNVEPMSHIFPVNNVFREDVVVNGDDRENILANAPEERGGAFVVPKTVE